MNEQIKSLLAQAHLQVKEEFGIIDTNRVAERFADLIIDECKRALTPHLRDMISRGQAIDLINRQFGITPESQYNKAVERGADALAKEIDQQVLDQILRKSLIRSSKLIDKGRMK